MKRVLFVSNVPAPYRVDFFNELGLLCQLTVVFEAPRASLDIQFNWNDDRIKNFTAVYLSSGHFAKYKIHWKIFKYLIKDYDTIIMSNYANPTEGLGMLFLKLRGKTFYYETDGGLIKAEDSKLKKSLKHFMLSLASGYFSPSVPSDAYLQYYTKPNIKLYRYHFTSLFNDDIIKELMPIEKRISLRKEMGIPESRVILAIGRFFKRKAYDVLINAFQQNQFSDIGLYMIGGEPTDEYITLARNNKNIHFIGFAQKDVLKKYMSVADLFVHPTLQDVWGLVINESMGYGLPVITTDKCVAGLSMIPSDYIVPAGNVDALATKIADVINDDDLLKEMSALNMKTIQSYTFQQMAKDHID